MLNDLKQQVCEANLELVAHGLVTVTWGNVSAVSADRELLVIKPSGISYDDLNPDQIVVVNVSNVKVIGGKLKLSSDTQRFGFGTSGFSSITAAQASRRKSS